jgi:hypothetical protein
VMRPSANTFLTSAKEAWTRSSEPTTSTATGRSARKRKPRAEGVPLKRSKRTMPR